MFPLGDQPVLNDISHYVADVQTCSTNLLRDEARGRHAWSGIDFEQVNLVAFRDNIVNTNDAVTIQKVVNHGGQLADSFRKTFADAGRSDFVALIIVLGGIVEELVL